MPPTEATVPLAEPSRAKKPQIVAAGNGGTQNGANGDYRRKSSTVPAGEELGASEGESAGNVAQLSWLGRLSYNVSIAIGQFFYR